MIKTIGIVGAGIAGLASAKVLKAFGYDVTVFEKEPDVGGVWSRARRYPGLSTQNPRDTYALSDFPMPRDYPEWPRGEQVQVYLESYAEAFDIAGDILFGTEVRKATYDKAAEHWHISAVRTANDDTVERQVDFLVVCNGIFSAPFVPEYPGSDVFEAAGGRICHTSELNDIEDTRGRNLLVVGYGKSSCDVAEAAVGIAQRITLAARHLTWKMPRFIGKVNFKYIMLTRMGEGLFKYIRLKGFDRFLHGVGLPLRNAMLGSVEKQIERQLDMEGADLHPHRPLETIARSTVSNVSGDFFAHAKAGSIIVEKETEIVRLQVGEAELSNGTTVPADVIVCGTGWRQNVAWLEADVMDKVTDGEGNFRLYQSVLPIGVPRIAFNGYNSSFFSQLSAEVCALWLAEYLQGGVTLPSAEAMNRYCDERLAWMEARTDGKHCKGTNIIPFSVHQMDELLDDIDLNLNPLKRFTQWLLPVTGSDYKDLSKRLLARHGIR